VFALLSNAHSRHNGCCQGVFQFFSEEEEEGEGRIPLRLHIRMSKKIQETETGRKERREEK